MRTGNPGGSPGVTLPARALSWLMRTTPSTAPAGMIVPGAMTARAAVTRALQRSRLLIGASASGGLAAGPPGVPPERPVVPDPGPSRWTRRPPRRAADRASVRRARFHPDRRAPGPLPVHLADPHVVPVAFHAVRHVRQRLLHR